jgi:hypothetical protein
MYVGMVMFGIVGKYFACLLLRELNVNCDTINCTALTFNYSYHVTTNYLLIPLKSEVRSTTAVY